VNRVARVWRIGSPDEYTPPVEVTVKVTPFFAVVTPPVLGVIMYNSLSDFAKNSAKTVATEEEADIEDSEGIATMDSAMGAP
jgi:hypothetical protein